MYQKLRTHDLRDPSRIEIQEVHLLHVYFAEKTVF